MEWTSHASGWHMFTRSPCQYFIKHIYINIHLTVDTWVKIRGRCTGKWTRSSLQFYQMHGFIIVMHSQTWINIILMDWFMFGVFEKALCLAHTNLITRSTTNRETDALIIFLWNAFETVDLSCIGQHFPLVDYRKTTWSTREGT